MEIDISALGPLFYLIFALPGFIGVASFRLFFGIRKKWCGWEWTCWSAICGIVIFAVWEWTMRNHADQIPKLIANPIVGAAFLSLFAIFVLLLLRTLVWILKLIFYGIIFIIAITPAIWEGLSDWFENRKEKKSNAKHEKNTATDSRQQHDRRGNRRNSNWSL